MYKARLTVITGWLASGKTTLAHILPNKFKYSFSILLYNILMVPIIL